MKEPERFIVFVNYDDVEIAFEFDADNFALNLYLTKNYGKSMFAHPMYSISAS